MTRKRFPNNTMILMKGKADGTWSSQPVYNLLRPVWSSKAFFDKPLVAVSPFQTYQINSSRGRHLRAATIRPHPISTNTAGSWCNLLLWGAQKAEIQAPGFMKAVGNWYGSCQRWEKLRKSWSTPTINVFPKNYCLFLFYMHGCFACMYVCTICFPGALRVQRRVADAWT